MMGSPLKRPNDDFMEVAQAIADHLGAPLAAGIKGVRQMARRGDVTIEEDATRPSGLRVIPTVKLARFMAADRGRGGRHVG